MEISNIINSVCSELDSTFEEIDSWFLLSENERSYRPKDGGWTINEILKHISLTNKFLLILIQKGKSKALKNVQERDLNEQLKNY